MQIIDRNKIIDECIDVVRKVPGDFYDVMYCRAIRDAIADLERLKQAISQEPRRCA